jgi:hypothetical protein
MSHKRERRVGEKTKLSWALDAKDSTVSACHGYGYGNADLAKTHTHTHTHTHYGNAHGTTRYGEPSDIFASLLSPSPQIHAEN